LEKSNQNIFTQWIAPLIAVAFIAGSAQLTINLDWQEIKIPISGQSFAVLVSGMLLGRKWGLVSVLLYLILGGLGLPFFADGGSGWESFTKGSAGFLIGFAIAAFVVGWLADIGWRSSAAKTLLAMLIGTMIIVGAGVLWLTYLYGWRKALEYGFYPFVWGAIVKIILGAVAVNEKVTSKFGMF
jgi:biotin transporter BioY